MEFDSRRNLLSETVPLTVKGSGIAWTPDLKLLLDRHLERLAERFPRRIRVISASLEDVNGPRGGIDKKCRICLMLKRHGQVSVCARSSRSETAIKRATERVRTVLRRKLQGIRFRASGVVDRGRPTSRSAHRDRRPPARRMLLCQTHR